MTKHFTTLDELGSGPGFRKIRPELDITAFGVNAIVLPPGMSGKLHAHETQDELYFVHAGTARFEVGDPNDPEVFECGPGGMAHVTSTTPRIFRNIGDDELTMLIVGGKDGYVSRDGLPVAVDGVASF
jgi:oxalate decarboxylase/phosphoglucose isomerase-like protein (cupin superfamily)